MSQVYLSVQHTSIMYNRLLLGLLFSIFSLCIANPTPAPAASPTGVLKPRDTITTTCNADNCYRAAKSVYDGLSRNALASLCTSYTSPPPVVTTLTSSPVTLPSSCSAPRITSICDCLFPAEACATRAAEQRVQNPSFEQGGGETSPYWSFSDTANNFYLYQNSMQDYSGSYGV